MPAPGDGKRQPGLTPVRAFAPLIKPPDKAGRRHDQRDVVALSCEGAQVVVAPATFTIERRVASFGEQRGPLPPQRQQARGEKQLFPSIAPIGGESGRLQLVDNREQGASPFQSGGRRLSGS